jgi:hypothetical protein
MNKAVSTIVGAGGNPSGSAIAVEASTILQKWKDLGLLTTARVLAAIRSKTEEIERLNSPKYAELLQKMREFEAISVELEKQFGGQGRLVVVASRDDLLHVPLPVASTARLDCLRHAADLGDGVYEALKAFHDEVCVKLESWSPSVGDPAELREYVASAAERAEEWVSTRSVRVQSGSVVPGPTRCTKPFSAMIRAVVRTRVELALFDAPTELDPERGRAHVDALYGAACRIVARELPLPFRIAVMNLGEASGALPERAAEIQGRFEQELRAALAPPVPALPV